MSSKAMIYKFYRDRRLLTALSQRWKNLSINIVIELLVFSNWKSETCNLILVIIYQLMKIVYYESVQVTNNTPNLGEIILDVIVWYHGLPNSFVSDRGSVLISKFWSSLYLSRESKGCSPLLFIPRLMAAQREKTAS